MLRAKLKATMLLIVIFVNVVELGGKRTRGFPSKREGFPLGESISAEVSPCATQCPHPAGTPRGMWSPTSCLFHMQNRPGFPPPLRTHCVVTIRGKYFFEPGPTKAGLDANDGVV